MNAEFERIGAVRIGALLSAEQLARVVRLFGSGERPGKRLDAADVSGIADLLVEDGPIGFTAMRLLGAPAFPVRALLLEKSPKTNWQLGFHQDRTVAVRNRADVVGFGPWSVKSGQLHVQPPQSVLAAMITLRVHVDEATVDSGALEVLPGSHRLGRLTQGKIDELTAKVRPLICFAKPGDVWAYRTPIVHGSASAGRLGRRRRVLQVDYASAPLPAPLEWARLLPESLTT